MSDHCVHCDPLCRGNDKNPHGCGTAIWDQGECPACRERAGFHRTFGLPVAVRDERAAIGVWLVSCRLPQVANQIDNGLHLVGDDGEDVPMPCDVWWNDYPGECCDDCYFCQGGSTHRL